MGLPLYLRHILDKYPHCVLRRFPPCARLFVDFNGLIHNAAAAVKVGGDGIVDDAAVIAETMRALRALVDLLAPRQLLFIAVDGVPPAAKMMQQRLRRYMNRSGAGGQGFDTNAITPGTAFMADLNRALHEQCGDMTSARDCVVSDSAQPGEGEDKIFRYLAREKGSSSAGEGWDLVHGADADLIVRGMLALSEDDDHRPLGVVRPDASAANVIDVAALRDAVCRDMRPGFAPQQQYRTRIITDYVCLLSLVGNDFLPPLTFLHHKPFAVPFLMRLYAEVVVASERWLVDGDYVIDWQCFGQLLSRIAEQEDARVAESHRRFMAATPHRTCRAEEEDAADLPLRVKHPPDMDLTAPGWRKQWYRRLLNFTDHVDGRHRATAPYLAGIEWTLRYYLMRDSGVGIDMMWYYPFPYSPTARDLQVPPPQRSHVQRQQQTCKALQEHPQLLLALVLPPASFRRLLPEAFHPMLDDPRLGCACFYVEEYETFTYLKRYSWECVPNLPPIDIDIVARAFLRIAKGATTILPCAQRVVDSSSVAPDDGIP